jgi:hypothetical protein
MQYSPMVMLRSQEVLMSIPAGEARSSAFRLASGADLMTEWFDGAAQAQKNMVSEILFAIAEGSVFASYMVVDDAADRMAFFVLTGGGLAVKARINVSGSFDVIYIGSSCDAPGLDRAPSSSGHSESSGTPVKNSLPERGKIVLSRLQCHCST